MPSNHLILWRPLLLLPSIFPSIRDFSSESSVHIRWPKYWNFSFSISPSSECSGLTSLNIDWFHLLAVQGTCRSLLQHHSLKASIFGVCDHWEDHNLDYRDTWQSNVSAFQHTVYVCHHFPAKKQSSDFMAAVTICSDFGAQEDEICHYFPFYLPCSNIYVCVCVCVCMYMYRKPASVFYQNYKGVIVFLLRGSSRMWELLA